MDRVLADLTPKMTLSPDDLDHINDILDAALAWKNGEIDGNTLLRMGAIEYQGPRDSRPHPSPPYSRWIAIGTCIKNKTTREPRCMALMEFLDKLVAHKYVVTTQGVYESADLHQHDEAIRLLRGASLTTSHLRTEAA